VKAAQAIEFSGGGSIFPFLSVMFCTIGVLALVLVAGSMKAAGRAGDTDKELARVQTQVEGLAREEETAAGQLTDLTHKTEVARRGMREVATLRSLTARIGQQEKEEGVLMGRVAQARTRRDEAQALPTKITLARRMGAARTQVAQRTGTRDALRRDIAALKKTEGDLTASIDEARRDAKSGVIRVTPGAALEGRTGVLVDLDVNAIVVHADVSEVRQGERIPLARARGAQGVLGRVATAIGAPGSGRFAVLLVRPGALAAFREAAAQMTRCRAPFLAEPLEAGISVTGLEQQ
jgi:hypothetical protein